jgi:phosphatidylinositol N-acetylglucosaminyltransferase subunit Q
MVQGGQVMRIFWPLGASRQDKPGVVIGWRNSKLDLFVVAILQDVEASLSRKFM